MNSNKVKQVEVGSGGASLGLRWATAYPQKKFNFLFYVCKYKYTTKFKYKLQVGPPNYLHLHVYAL